MRILIVAANFPPYNTPGAVRLGGFAGEWTKSGADVRVISAGEQAYPATLIGLGEGIPAVFLDWPNPEGWLRRFTEGKDIGRIGYGSGLGFLRSIYNHVSHLIYWPDNRGFWMSPAVRYGRRLFENWMPDVILGSAKPFSAHLIAKRLSEHSGVPWVAEFRDPWASDYTRTAPRWRQAIDDRWERETIGSASDVVTVSRTLANDLAVRFGRPVHHVYTGYEGKPSDRPDTSGIHIVYTGSIFPTRQDARPLFEALHIMGSNANFVKVTFVGRLLGNIGDLKKEFRLDQVNLVPAVDRPKALEMQRSADVLLTITSNSIEERGTITTKFNEYLGVDREMLVIGGDNNEAARIVHTHGLGLASTSPDVIANWLARLVDEKRSGRSMRAKGAVIETFSRVHQAKVYLDILSRSVKLR